jgi:hypothetical protein
MSEDKITLKIDSIDILTQHWFREGKDYERERIIKLLDNWKCGHPNCDGDKTEVCYPKHYLIKLIKEETK